VAGKSYDLQILVKLVDQASKGAQGVGASLQNMGKEADAALSALQPLGTAMAATGAAGTALVASATMSAARVQELGVVLNIVGKNAGYSEAQITAYEAGVRRMGITHAGARQSLIQMAQAEVDLSYATDLARVAQDAAVIAQTDSSDAMQRLTWSIQTGSVIYARTLGLIVNYGAAYEKMAAQVGKTVEQLTEEERTQARVNEMLRAGTSIEGAYDAAMTTSGKQLRSLNRLWVDSEAALGKAFLPVMDKAVQSATSMLKAFLAMEPAQQRQIASWLAIGTAVASGGGALILLTPQVMKLVSSLGAFLKLSGGVAEGLQFLQAGFTASEVAATGFAGTVAVAIPVLAALAATLGVVYVAHQRNVQVTKGHEDVTNAFAEQLQRVVAAGGSADDVMQAYTTAQQSAAAAVDRAANSHNVMERMAARFVDTAKLEKDGLLAVQDALAKTATGYDDYRSKLDQAVAATGYMINAQGDLVEVTDTGMVRVIQAGFQMSEAGFAAEQGWAAVLDRRMVAAMLDTASATRNAADATDGLAASTATLDERVGALAVAVAGPIRQANEQYAQQQVDIRQQMAEARAELEKLERTQGAQIVTQQAGVIEQDNARRAAEKLANAQELLANNTDPARQLEFEAGVARAAAAQERANAALEGGSVSYVDNSARIAELNAQLVENEARLAANAAAHEDQTKRFLYDMMMQRLAMDGWTEAEQTLSLAAARDFGLIDQASFDAAMGMNAALTEFAGGAGVNETMGKIDGIYNRLANDVPGAISVLSGSLIGPLPAAFRTTGQAIEETGLRSDILRGKFDGIPRSISTQFRTPGLAEAHSAAQAYQDVLNNMPRTVSTLYELHTQGLPIPPAGPPGGIPGHATGTMSASPGFGMVGERGAEIVTGPTLMLFQGGERVYNAQDTNRMLGGTNVTNNNALTFNVVAPNPQRAAWSIRETLAQEGIG